MCAASSLCPVRSQALLIRLRLSEGLGVSLLADQPINHVNCSGNGQLYNGLIAPLVNTTIRGRCTRIQTLYGHAFMTWCVRRLAMVSGGELTSIRRR